MIVDSGGVNERYGLFSSIVGERRSVIRDTLTGVRRASTFGIVCFILLPAYSLCLTPKVREPMAKQTVDQLNRVLQSENASRAAKCDAVFQLFADYVRPNADNDFSAVFLDHTWIGVSRIDVVRVVGGLIPIEWNPNTETLYYIALFPSKTDWSDHGIYLTLRRAQLEQQNLIRLLNGQQTENGAEVGEFALCRLSQEADCLSFPPRTRKGR